MCAGLMQILWRLGVGAQMVFQVAPDKGRVTDLCIATQPRSWSGAALVKHCQVRPLPSVTRQGSGGP